MSPRAERQDAAVPPGAASSPSSDAASSPRADAAVDAGGAAADGGQVRAVLRRHAGGVVVITTYDPADRLQPLGFTATSLVSVSLDPPTVSFNVSRASRSGRAWLTAARGLVHVLDDSQEQLAHRFATSGVDKFHGAAWHRAEHGLPELAGGLGWLLVHTAERILVADHLVVAATVVRSELRAGGGPLLRCDGAFHRLA
ncbi:MAG: flavin reductase family protein [Dermatophilaceae bacterium]